VFQPTHQRPLSQPLNFLVRLLSEEEQHSLLKMLHFFITVEPALLRETMRSVPESFSSPEVSCCLVAKKNRWRTPGVKTTLSYGLSYFLISYPVFPLIMTHGNWSITQ